MMMTHSDDDDISKTCDDLGKGGLHERLWDSNNRQEYYQILLGGTLERNA